MIGLPCSRVIAAPISLARSRIKLAALRKTASRSSAEAARQRAARERAERIARALEQLPEIEAVKKPKDRAKARASTTDPEARVMKMSDGGFRPAYNVQLATDTQSQIITGIDVSNSRSFTYLKPRFDLRWDRNDRDQVRATLERTVSQLDFSDFVASYDGRQDQISGGNPELEPERAAELIMAARAHWFEEAEAQESA